MLRAVIVGSVALAVAGAVAAAASASCAPPEDERTRLERADAAFVGEFVRRTDDEALFFRVERGVKGEFGNEVAVRDAYPRSSVAMQPTPGTRIGLFLMREGSEYTANECQFVDPDALIRAAGMDADPPEVDIMGPIRHSISRAGRIRFLAALSERSGVAVSARLVLDGRKLRGSVHVEQSASTGTRPDPVEIRVFIRDFGRRTVRRALQRGVVAALVVRVVARDRAGNRGVGRRTIELVR